jgi:hypothetical protein
VAVFFEPTPSGDFQAVVKAAGTRLTFELALGVEAFHSSLWNPTLADGTQQLACLTDPALLGPFVMRYLGVDMLQDANYDVFEVPPLHPDTGLPHTGGEWAVPRWPKNYLPPPAHVVHQLPAPDEVIEISSDEESH